MKESKYLEGQHQLIDTLRLIPAFQQFDNKKLENLLRLCKLRIYDSGELILQEGEEERVMYVLLSGCAQIAKSGKIIATLRRTGDIFGEMGLVDGEPRSATARAQGETTCLTIDAIHLEKLPENDFKASIYLMFAQILAHRLRITTENYLKVRNELDRLKSLANGS